MGIHRSSATGRAVALAFALVLAIPIIAPDAGVTGPSTVVAASPIVPAVAPPVPAVAPPALATVHLRPEAGGGLRPSLRGATAEEMAGLNLVAGTGPCAGMFEPADAASETVSHELLCTHGPDAIVRPSMVGSSGPILVDGDDYVPPPVPCYTSGPFVKVFYVYQSGHANRLASLRARIVRTVAAADDIYARSADSVGEAIRHVHWLMDGNCDLSITAVSVSAADIGAISPGPILVDLAGHTLASNQKALVFTDDAGTLCSGIAGIATTPTSDSPSASNPANSGYYAARVFGWCLNDPSLTTSELGDIASHEVMHTLGAVQNSAPNSSKHGHCTDGDDVMCYEDYPGVVLRSICPAEFPRTLDCNKDDFFNPAPPPGSYLSKHWNTANNVFLAKIAPTHASTTAPVVAIGSPGAGTTAEGNLTVTATATDPGGSAISRVDFYANDNLLASDTTAPYSAPLNTAATGSGNPYPNGSLRLDAVAWDAAGRWTFAPEVTITLANPRVGLTAPADAATVTGPVPWSAVPVVAAGRTVTKVEFLVDNVVAATDTTAPYGGTYTPDLTAGTARLSARVTDSGGFTGQGSDRWVYPNQLAMNLSMPLGGMAGTPITFLAAPNSTLFPPISQVEFFRRPSGGGTLTSLGIDAAPPYSATWAAPAAGDYEVMARVTINGGATGDSQISPLHVDPAQGGFGLTLNTPTAGSTVSGASVPVTATPTAPSGWTTSSVDFYADGTFLGEATGSPWSTAWDLSFSGSGPHLVSATASFINDNTFDTITLNTSGIVVSRAGPSPTLTAPLGGTTLHGTVTLTASVVAASDDPVNQVDFYANGRYVASASGSPWTTTWQTDGTDQTAIGDGAVFLRAIAYGSSTSAQSAPVSVTIANGGVAITAPAASSTVAGRTTLSASGGAAGGLTAERMTFFVDGVAVGSDDASPFALLWNSASVGNGAHLLTATASYSDGSSRTSTGRSFNVTAPGGPSQPVAHITAVPKWVAATTLPLTWSATPALAAIASYDVRYRRAAWNGAFGSYVTWRSATTATGATFSGSTGSTYCFSVRARDAGTHLSAWTAETCTSTPLDDRSLSRHGTWSKLSSASYYRSTYLRTSSFGASVTRSKVVARRIALLVTVCHGCGSVKVYWGSTLLKTVNLNATATAYQKLISISLFSAVKTGTLTIKVSSHSKKVYIDGVVIRRVN